MILYHLGSLTWECVLDFPECHSNYWSMNKLKEIKIKKKQSELLEIQTINTITIIIIIHSNRIGPN